MKTTPSALRARAEAKAAHFPPLLARAEQLAGAVLLGEHGRRRAGLGDDFWQYRPMQPGDSRRMVDWRRSARSDAQFVRQKEWQIAQSVQIWVDQAASMRFSSASDTPEKADRARILALSLAILLIRGGERVGLTGDTLPPRRGEVQIDRLATALSSDHPDDYAIPDSRGLLPHARALFVSDFLGHIDGVTAALTKAADRGITGVLFQILDPGEEAFPYQGRTIFHSVGGTLAHETLKAGDLRNRYLDRLAARKDTLTNLARATGWRYHCHHTGDSAQSALLWLYRALDGDAG
ncbi:DUF58 domain-containing protein [Alisedimentitalea sp. MJ-SS2]|uniref:DUF58 domain-containing protein n=1 Tax=Aliisedimentitalea sp. MJ-SS2 TaxID=3049795 RepID=UPI00290F4C69|nr:DUF58 domain-containing protein [Alisedimentitalea sp. MJ-SS2]MDU8929624.1 DUF58 domain-containing protein [Alisedimentitalea sp. MJ-SS2]